MDNTQRAASWNVTFILRTEPSTRGRGVRMPNSSRYRMPVSVAEAGTYMLEIFADGAQVLPEKSGVNQV